MPVPTICRTAVTTALSAMVLVAAWTASSAAVAKVTAKPAATKVIAKNAETVRVPQFPIRAHSGRAFEDGGGADWYVEAVVSNNGRIDMGTDMRAHRSMNGWCGRFAVFLFDAAGNVLGRYGMAEDHSWCVNGRLSPAGQHVRNDELHQIIPAQVLPRIASVSIVMVTAPTGKITLSDAKAVARDIITVLKPSVL